MRKSFDATEQPPGGAIEIGRRANPCTICACESREENPRLVI